MENLNRRTFVKSFGLLPGVSQVLHRAVDGHPASADNPAFPPQFIRPICITLSTSPPRFSHQPCHYRCRRGLQG